jgi:hypothetical protein
MDRVEVVDGVPFLDGRESTEQEVADFLAADPEAIAYRATVAARDAAIAALSDPLVPRTVTGTTVATVKSSADAAIKDIAAQTEARLAAIADVLGG